MAEAPIRAVRVRITGRVQGVYYRAWTGHEARARGLSGWVRNERDGSVAAVIAGPAPDVAAMLEAFREGPPDARVIAVESREIDPAEVPEGFDVEP